jgi:hypothetical protein
MKFKFELGDKVISKIQKFKGIITCKYEYMYGCLRYEVTPEKLGKDGKIQDVYCFDEDALVLQPGGRKDHKLSDGGPTPLPPRRIDPGRGR